VKSRENRKWEDKGLAARLAEAARRWAGEQRPTPEERKRVLPVLAGMLTLAALGGCALWRMPQGTAERAQAAPLPRHAKQGSARVAAGDYVVPKDFQGTLVRNRIRHFPKKLLAITFDDGPDPKNTPLVLAALAKAKAHATFFVIGRQVDQHPKLVRAIMEGGHAIGLHSYSHKARPTPAQAVQEIDRTVLALKKATGRRTELLRPPYGLTNTNLTNAARKRGYSVILWTVASADTMHINTTSICNNVIHTPNPGDIILLHDGPGHARTANAVPRILSELQKAGFEFVTMPELMRAWDEWKRTPEAKAFQTARLKRARERAAKA
jgi:chitin deacetylase